MDFLDDDPAKVVGPTQSSKAVVDSEGRVYLQGSTNPDIIYGSQYDDIIISGGAHYSHGGSGPGLEIIDGKGGRDTVLIDGRRASYKITIPNDAYPTNSDAAMWQQNNGFLFGSTIMLQHLSKGDRILIINCERLVFLNDQPNDMTVAQAIEDHIKNGTVTAIEIQDLIRQIEETMTAAAQNTARLMATRDFAIERQKLGYNPTIAIPGSSEEQRINASALEAAHKLHPNIMSYQAVQPAGSKKYILRQTVPEKNK